MPREDAAAARAAQTAELERIGRDAARRLTARGVETVPLFDMRSQPAGRGWIVLRWKRRLHRDEAIGFDGRPRDRDTSRHGALLEDGRFFEVSERNLRAGKTLFGRRRYRQIWVLRRQADIPDQHFDPEAIASFLDRHGA